MLWVAKSTPGVWPKPLSADQARAPARRPVRPGRRGRGLARRRSSPSSAPPRTIHDAACLPEGFRVKGLRGEPTHWVPWDEGRAGLRRADRGRGRVPRASGRRAGPRPWPTGLRALTFRKPRPAPRLARAARIAARPGRRGPDRPQGPADRLPRGREPDELRLPRRHASARRPPENFPLFVADLVARADDAYLTPSTRALLHGGDPSEYTFATSQALLDYATHRLLWGWYKRDRDEDLERPAPNGSGTTPTPDRVGSMRPTPGR